MTDDICYFDLARQGAKRNPELESRIYTLEAPHKDAEILHYCYRGLGLSVKGTADKLEVSIYTIEYWMKKHGLDRRSPAEAARNAHSDDGISSNYTEKGYLVFNIYNKDDWVTIYGHQVVALLENDLEEVFDEDTHVHHRYPIPFENVPQLDVPANLEVLDLSEHLGKHGKDEFEVPDLEEVLDSAEIEDDE